MKTIVAFTYSKSTIATIEKVVKYVQSLHLVLNVSIVDFILVNISWLRTI